MNKFINNLEPKSEIEELEMIENAINNPQKLNNAIITIYNNHLSDAIFRAHFLTYIYVKNLITDVKDTDIKKVKIVYNLLKISDLGKHDSKDIDRFYTGIIDGVYDIVSNKDFDIINGSYKEEGANGLIPSIKTNITDLGNKCITLNDIDDIIYEIEEEGGNPSIILATPKMNLQLRNLIEEKYRTVERENITNNFSPIKYKNLLIIPDNNIDTQKREQIIIIDENSIIMKEYFPLVVDLAKTNLTDSKLLCDFFVFEIKDESQNGLITNININ